MGSTLASSSFSGSAFFFSVINPTPQSAYSFEKKLFYFRFQSHVQGSG
jgi:hypothetical protein